MKRPRRPVKKTARKAAPKRRKPAPRARATRPAIDQSPEWQTVFDIPKPPPGFAYQWAPVTAIFGMELKGWSRVPFSRHPELGKERNFDGYIVHAEMTLFQQASELVDVKLDAARKKAKSQHLAAGGEALEALGNHRGPPWYGGVPILSEKFIATAEYQRPEAGPSVVDLTIKFHMPYCWRDTAAALGLTETEYVRRRVIMEGMLLAADAEGSFYCARITPQKVDE